MGRRQVSWLPGLPLHAFPIRRQRVGGRACSRVRWAPPVTVAGPRRILTGLPLTTDRVVERILPHAGRGGSARDGAEIGLEVSERDKLVLGERSMGRDQATGRVEVV